MDINSNKNLSIYREYHSPYDAFSLLGIVPYADVKRLFSLCVYLQLGICIPPHTIEDPEIWILTN